MKKIELTPEWLLDNFSHTLHCNGTDALIVSSIEESHWVKLAFDTLEIDYSDNEYFNEDNETFNTHFEFNLEDIKEECPNLYTNLKELGDKNYDSTI